SWVVLVVYRTTIARGIAREEIPSTCWLSLAHSNGHDRCYQKQWPRSWPESGAGQNLTRPAGGNHRFLQVHTILVWPQPATTSPKITSPSCLMLLTPFRKRLCWPGSHPAREC